VTGPRLVVWRGLDDWRVEVSEVSLSDDGMGARGTQIGLDPVPYRLDYELEAPGLVTRSLEIEVIGEGWRRSLRLSNDGKGSWECNAGESGEVELPAPGGSTGGLEDALDCDLGLSPLTNMMPIQRHQLHRRPVSEDFVMAWVAVPDLGLHVSAQRYEHVSADGEGAVVRFVDRGLFEGFTAELELDSDGIVRVYPDLAERVNPG
jgi:hypothetical protein